MSNRSERLAALFEAAVEHDPGDRLAVLRDACRDDSDLRREVETMLAAVDDSLVIDEPVGQSVAALMPDNRANMIGTETSAPSATTCRARPTSTPLNSR